MVQVTDLPKTLKAFSVHGVEFQYDGSSDQAIGTCPFCGREAKFYMSVENGMWDCKVCGLTGNINTFFHKISEVNSKKLAGPPLKNLVNDRGLSALTLRRWGLGWDGNQYTIPVPSLSNPETSLSDLKRYKIGGRLMASPTAKSNIFAAKGAMHEDSIARHHTIWIMEGEWDTLAMNECLHLLKLEGHLAITSTTGAGSFKPDWVIYLQDKDVVLMFDHDPAGVHGRLRTGRFLEGIAKSIKVISWPSNYKEGYDFRDLYMKHGIEAFKKAGEMLVPFTDVAGVPQQKVKKRLVEPVQASAAAPEPPSSKPKTPRTGRVHWSEITKRYKEWLFLTNTDCLSVMFGTLIANRLPGDPLWLFLVAPPGGSKSELLMSLSKCPEIYTVTTITSHTLISGSLGAGGVDPSLLPKLNGKVLIIKDFTSILSMPMLVREEILGILRDAYDGQTQKVFGNGIRRSYNSKFGIIAGVTPAIDQFSAQHSMLGERFLRYRIILPSSVLGSGHIINRALDNLTHETDMRDILQNIARDILEYNYSDLDNPGLSAEFKVTLTSLAQLVAMLRGVVSHDKYTREVLSRPSQEIGTRLAKQLAKLAMGISILMGDKTVSKHTLGIIAKVARDTIPDRIEDVLKQIYIHTIASGDGDGSTHCKKTSCHACKASHCCSCGDLSEWTGLPSGTILTLLEDLRMLKVVERARGKDPTNTDVRWKLTLMVQHLIETSGFLVDEKTWGKTKKEKGEKV